MLLWLAIFFCFYTVGYSDEGTKSLIWDGTIMIGGVNQVHEHRPDYYTHCGEISESLAIMSEAHLWSTDYVNEYLKNRSKTFTLGAHLVDTCYSEAVGLQNSVTFVKNASSGLCFSHNVTGEDEPWKNVYVVTGTFASGVGKYITYLFQAYCIPVIGSQSTSTELEDKRTFPYFLRTIASDEYQAQAVYEVLRDMGWNRSIAVFYDSFTYGQSMMKEFKAIVQDQKDICIDDSYYVELSYESREDVNSTGEWNKICVTLQDMLDDRYPKRVIVLFANFMVADRLFNKMHEWGLDGKFQFVGVDAWGSLLDMNSNISRVVNGSITTEPKLDALKPFHEYLRKVTPLIPRKGRQRNPWLAELIAVQHNCSIGDSNSTKPCTSDMKLKNIPQGALRRSRTIFDAVFLIGKAMANTQDDYCGGSSDFCDYLTQQINVDLIMSYLKNTSFDNDAGSFSFYQNTTSARPSYLVLQYQTFNETHPGDNWKQVGTYEIGNDGIVHSEIDKTKLIILDIPITETISNCTKDCLVGQHKYHINCCYRCMACENLFTIVNNSDQNSPCRECLVGTIPDKNRKFCVDEDQPPLVEIPSIGMVILFGFCFSGLILVFISIYTLSNQRNTPMVKAATGDLMPPLLLSITLLFLCPAIMTPTYSPILCGVVWCLLSSALSIGHLAVLAKAVRLARPALYVCLLRELHGEDRSRFSRISCPKEALSKIIICIGLLLHVIIMLIWILLQPPTILSNKVASKGVYIHICSSNSDFRTLIVLMFCPVVSLFASIPLFRRALKSPFIFVVYQARFALGASFCFIVNYSIMYVQFGIQDSTETFNVSLVIMCIATVTAFLLWFSVVFPLVYALIAKKDQNIEECIKRKRAFLFVEGTRISMVTPVPYGLPSPPISECSESFSFSFSDETTKL